MNVPAGETSLRLQGLRPLTDYQVTVVALYANSIGEAVSATARTSEQFCQPLIDPILLTAQPLNPFLGLALLIPGGAFPQLPSKG